MQYCSLLYIFIFLPVVILIYNIFPKKHKWKVLLFFSYVFFFLISGKLIVYLLLSTLLIHYFGLWINKIKTDLNNELLESNNDPKKIKKDYKKREFKIVVLAIFILIGLLVILKYSQFIGVNVNTLLEKIGLGFRITIPKFLVPIGISFYTLQGLSYIFDLYNDKIQVDDNLGRLALFMAFFPGIMEGPIARYSDTAFNLYEGNKITYHNLSFGFQRILWGVMKKLIVADRLNAFIGNVFLNYNNLDGGIIFFGALCYTVQLYMEFSGTMDMVIGSAEIFGVKMPENFRQPFFSKNISEFWTRWHITLGSWFKDYVFYPLSLSKPVKKLSKITRKIFGNHIGSLFAASIALFVVWFFNGIWHGAAWMYIFFGLYHFTLIFLGKIFNPLIIKITDKLKIKRSSRIYMGIQILTTFILVVFGELFFRARGLRNGLKMFKKIFTTFSIDSFINGNIFNLGADKLDFLIVLIILLIILVVSILKEKGINIRELVASKNIVVRWLLYYTLIFIIIIFGAYGPGYAPVDPIYANF